MNIKEDLNKLISMAYGEIPLNLFKKWVFESDYLEEIIGKEFYLKLIQFDYHQKDASYELKKLIKQEWNKNMQKDIVIERILQLLNGILDNTIDLAYACNQLICIKNEGYTIIPNEFIGYDSELDDIPLPAQYNQWDREALKQKFEKAEIYRDQIVESSKMLIQAIEVPI